MENTKHIPLEIALCDTNTCLKQYNLLEVAERMVKDHILKEMYLYISKLDVSNPVTSTYKPYFKDFSAFTDFSSETIKKLLVKEILETITANNDMNENAVTKEITCKINELFQFALAIIMTDSIHFCQRNQINQGVQPFDWLKDVHFVKK